MRRRLDPRDQLILALVCFSQGNGVVLKEVVLFQVMCTSQWMRAPGFQMRLKRLVRLKFLTPQGKGYKTWLLPSAFTAVSWEKAEELLASFIEEEMNDRERLHRARLKKVFWRGVV